MRVLSKTLPFMHMKLLSVVILGFITTNHRAIDQLTKDWDCEMPGVNINSHCSGGASDAGQRKTITSNL